MFTVAGTVLAHFEFSRAESCLLGGVIVDTITALALLTIGALVLQGHIAPLISQAGCYALIGVGAFSALPFLFSVFFGIYEYVVKSASVNESD